MTGRGTMRGTSADNQVAKFATRQSQRAQKTSRELRQAYESLPTVMYKHTFDQFVAKLETQAQRNKCSISMALKHFLASRSAQRNTNKRHGKAQARIRRRVDQHDEIRQAFLRLSEVDQAILSEYDLTQLRDIVARRLSRIVEIRKSAITEKEKAWISLFDNVQALRDDQDRHRVDGLHESHVASAQLYPANTLKADLAWLQKLNVVNWPSRSQQHARELLMMLQRLNTVVSS